MTVPAGRLIAFEGIDGCGKTTQARILSGSLGAVLTHEPGATALGRALRRILLGDVADGAGGGTGALPALDAGTGVHLEPVARAEALLMAADRAQHVTEVVRPALAAGRWVVTDRFSASTLAYQGYGQGLPVAMLAQLVEWAADGIVPDLTVLVDVPTDVARARLTASPDRLEQMDGTFFGRVRAGYLRLAAEDPNRWVVVDGAEPAAVVAAAVATVVRERLGGTAPAGGGPTMATRQ